MSEINISAKGTALVIGEESSVDFTSNKNTITGTTGANVRNGEFKLIGRGVNKFEAKYYGITANGNSNVEVSSVKSTIGDGDIIDNGWNIITSQNTEDQLEVGVQAQDGANIIFLATQGNKIDNTSVAAINAIGENTQVKFFAQNNNNNNGENRLYGSILAYKQAEVYICGYNNTNPGDSSSLLASYANYISSSSVVKDAGDLDGNDKFEGKEIVSTIYAENGAVVNIDGESNYISSSISSNLNRSGDAVETWERSIWAYDGGKVNVSGYTNITAKSWTENNNAVAIVAGTKQGLTEDSFDEDFSNTDLRANVIVKYNNKDNNLSAITGNIISAYAGYIDIAPASESDGIDIKGSLIAGNNGVLNVDLGKEGVLEGHIDDYGDAGTINNNHKLVFQNQDFSSGILKGGAVNLTMGDGSRWEVSRQSWVTNVNVTGSALINLNNIEQSTQGHALTIYNLNGRGTVDFAMHLDGNRSLSDMLYIKNAVFSGTYNIHLDSAIDFDDIYQGGNYDNLRFATIGNGNHDVKFNVYIKDEGLHDNNYIVANSNYNSANKEENDAYNGSEFGASKPGTDTVEDFFSADGAPVEVGGAESAAGENEAVSLLYADYADNEESADDSRTEALSAEDSTNAVDYYLTGQRTSSYSDAAKTVVDLSRANYANAVYMDTLNKRQGEARFVGDTDHGVWVRLRHDNIGKDDSFRTHNTMVEVGFEQRDVNDYGEFHTGFALDYMNGQIDYHTVDGDGDIERYGVWFYTTYLGNDGQYADLVLKYGHLKNDFGFNTKSQGEHVTGDYTNEVASISAEYGWKFSNSYNYYIEPQVQLQYSYVTGADYTTSQGSKVELDSIHSLIGRVGFRAGKDFNTETPITAYIRGDVLHEFLGDQDIYAYDNTGVMDVTYENDDTWYSAGVGLSVQSSENTYFFIEGEQVFGADNDSTYTVSGGFKHSF